MFVQVFTSNNMPLRRWVNADAVISMSVESFGDNECGVLSRLYEDIIAAKALRPLRVSGDAEATQ